MRGIICAKTGLGKAHYIDSFAGMMSSLRKIAGKTNIPSSPRDKSIHRPKTADRFRKNLRYGSILIRYHKKKAVCESKRLFLVKFAFGEWNMASPCEIASLWNICFANVKMRILFHHEWSEWFHLSGAKISHFAKQNISLFFSVLYRWQ